ncbi:MAG: hypothetical protein RIA08_09720 [Roseovarius sp.]|uniref:hypothetical protein n=1 Tax=Roseovarius sp. TaxID=1486281 RepID=UPI0032EE1501
MTCANLPPITMKTDNEFNVAFPWKNPDGTAKDITDGTVTAIARKADGTTASLTTEVHDAENGVQRVRYEGFTAGLWTVQPALTLDGDHQSYDHKVIVEESFEAPE